MGQCIAIGVGTTIFLKKSRRFGEDYTIETAKSVVKEILNLDLYNITEDDKFVHFKIKEEIFKNNLYDLLEGEYRELYPGQEIENLSKVKNKTPEELIQDLDNGTIRSYDFHFCEWGYGSNYLSFLLQNSEADLYIDMIAFYLTDKVIMESCGTFFKYIKSKIISSTDNPLKDDIFITIYG